jgi:hypothetical protein
MSQQQIAWYEEKLEALQKRVREATNAADRRNASRDMLKISNVLADLRGKVNVERELAKEEAIARDELMLLLGAYYDQDVRDELQKALRRVRALCNSYPKAWFALPARIAQRRGELTAICDEYFGRNHDAASLPFEAA